MGTYGGVRAADGGTRSHNYGGNIQEGESGVRRLAWVGMWSKSVDRICQNGSPMEETFVPVDGLAVTDGFAWSQNMAVVLIPSVLLRMHCVHVQECHEKCLNSYFSSRH